MVAAMVAGRGLPVWSRLGIIGAVLAVLWLVFLALGSQLVVSVHALYLVVLLAAMWFGTLATVLISAAIALLGGPLAPPGFIPESHAWYAWLVRGAFYVLVGAFASASVAELQRRRARLERMYGDLMRLYASTLRGLVLALEMKDEETSAHCERVATNAWRLGRALGLPRAEREALYWAGYLHDVGKLATPTHILSKPGRLTPDEFRVVQQHTVRGEALLLAVSPSFARLAEGVRHHHERWDGAGYPDGLAGTAIPLFGRILGVVDVFEALTSDRPYRPALGETFAAQVIREGAGSHFDPAIASAFLDLLAADQVHVEGRHGHNTLAEDHLSFDPRVLAGVAWPDPRSTDPGVRSDAN